MLSGTIIYSEFFGASDNYGKVIRACQVVNRLPIMNEHVKFFLTGSNAARVYVALNEIIKLGTITTQENLEILVGILTKTFGNLSDNDFMIYLNREVDEPYRVFIRMILGGSFYFFKDLFDPGTVAKFTETMIQSVGIVGYMDHLLAQRFDASDVFLRRCYEKDRTSFLAAILPSMEEYFGKLDKQINVAQLDGVFKYYTLEKFYKSILSICNAILFDRTNLEIDALNASFAILESVIRHIITTPEIVHDKIKSDTITVLFTKFSHLYNSMFIPQLTTETSSLSAGTQFFYPTPKLLVLLDNLIMLLDEIIKYMTKHNINYFYHRDKDGQIITRQTAIELIQTLLGIFEGFKNSASLNIALDFLINKATSIDCIATVWTLVLNVLYTLFVPENCLARIAVGKFDNDPKNLKLYMEILNDHLTDLHNMGYNHSAISELDSLQTHIATMCHTSITTGDQLQPDFKQACDTWVRKMVEMAASGTVGQGLFMLSKSDVIEIRQGRSTKLEKALCLAYYPTQQGNICSAASNGPTFFLKALGNIFTTGPFPMDIIKSTDSTNEVNLHRRLHSMGELMNASFRTIGDIQITIRPEGTTLPLSTYLNDHWKHLTETAIDLKIFFKENLTDIKRVTGIKYIALVLGGYFQVRLLVDDVSDQCRHDKHGELESFKTSREMMACKRGLLPLLIQHPLLALIKEIIKLDLQTGTIYDDKTTILTILKILGFLFSIKVKSTSPHSPYQLLRLEDSMLRFKQDFRVDEKNNPIVPFTTEILRPTEVMFIQFLKQLDVPDASIKCICSSKYNTKETVKNLDYETLTQLIPGGLYLYDAVGGSNDSESNSGRNSVSSLNKHKHKYKHNKLSRTNHTRKNKYKRNNKHKNKKHKSSPKYRKVVPSSRSGSQSNRKKSKSKLPHKNVTFKRRRARK